MIAPKPNHLALKNAYGDTEHVWQEWEWVRGEPPQRSVGQIGNSVMNYLKSRLGALVRGAARFTRKSMPAPGHKAGAVYKVFGDLLPDEVHFNRKAKRRYPEGPKWDAFAKICDTAEPQYRGYMCETLLGLDTIADDCQRAMDGYLALKNRVVFPLESDDAVIHFRCGDIVLPTNAQYGIPPFDYYVNAIPKTAKRVLIIGNFESKKSDAVNAMVDSQGDERCAAIQKRLPEYITQKTRKPVTVVSALPSSGMNRDIILAAHAPTFIGSISTFSLVAAVCNKGGKSVLPASALLLGRAWQGKTEALPDWGRIKFIDLHHALAADKWEPDKTLLSAKRTTAQVIQSLEKSEGDWDGFRRRRLVEG